MTYVKNDTTKTNVVNEDFYHDHGIDCYCEICNTLYAEVFEESDNSFSEYAHETECCCNICMDERNRKGGKRPGLDDLDNPDASDWGFVAKQEQKPTVF